MKSMKLYIAALLSLTITFSFAATALSQSTSDTTSEACPPKGCPIPDGEDVEYETTDLSYKRMHYSFGLCGSYFARKQNSGLDGMVGAYTNVEFRLLKLLSIGFDSYYGWLFGSGNQYLSSFNPGIKIFPMMYKNPKFQPYLYFGGHVFDGVFGSSSYGKVGMGQGGFGGLGFRYFPANIPMGIEFFVRASALYMQNPGNGGGRELLVPIFAFIGAVY